MRNALWTIFLYVCFGILSVVGIYFYQNGVHEPVPREIHEERITEETIKAQTIFSGTEPVIDSTGFLTIPNNTVVSDVKTGIRTELCSFSIPDEWKGKVVVKVMRLDQLESELYENAIVDSEVIQFFEKKTYQKYQQQEYAYREGAERKGKITELYVYNVKKNKLEDDPRELVFSSGKDYHALFYQFKSTDGLIDNEFAADYKKMAAVDYQGAIIRSFDQIHVANSYIYNRYVRGEGKNVFPSQKTVKHDDETPAKVQETLDKTPVYHWPDFSSPYMYSDHGSSYPYGAIESGGIPVTPVPTAVPQDTIVFDAVQNDVVNEPETTTDEMVIQTEPENDEAETYEAADVTDVYETDTYEDVVDMTNDEPTNDEETYIPDATEDTELVITGE